jgi:AcrR family transcriptional regulator
MMARTRAAEIAREATRKELLNAALKVFGEKGYPAATISDIVGAAGVTQGTFYLYFKNKSEIFSELLREYRETMITGLVVAGLENVKTKEDWLQMADRVAEFLLDHIKIYGDIMRLFISEGATIGSEFHEDSSAFTVGIINQIKRMLEHGKKMGLLRDDIDIEAVALTDFGALKEAMSPSFFDDTSRHPEDIIPRVVRSQARLVLK